MPFGDDLDSILAHPVRWGIGHALLALVVAYGAVLVATVALLAIMAEPGREAEFLDDASIGVLLVTQASLWVGYVGVTLWTSHSAGAGPRRDFGWRFAPRDWYQGLILGVGLQVIAVPVIYLVIFLFTERRDVSEAARDLTSIVNSPLDAVMLVLVVAIGAPLVEELFFRGLLLRSLQRRFGTTVAVIGSSVVFAAIHMQLLQFPALLMFGLVAALLTVRSGRLGPAIWTHVGFNAVTVLALLAAG